MTSVSLTEISWRERCDELRADRDYWRSRAEAWETRYVAATATIADLTAKVIASPPEQTDTVPPAIDMALRQASIGLPDDVARTMRRRVVATYMKAKGEEDQRVTVALDLLNRGDRARLNDLLGDDD